MNGTQVGIAVTLAVIVALAFLLFGGNVFTLVQPTTISVSEDARIVSQGDVMGMTANTASDEVTNTNQQPTMDARFPLQNVPTQLSYQDTVVGTGSEAVTGKKVTVHYTGYFTDGKVFDSSVTRGTPFSVVLGAGQVIQGWDQGFAGMKVGGKRTLIVPPDMGYGPNDYGPIPGGSTLVFDIELLGVE